MHKIRLAPTDQTGDSNSPKLTNQAIPPMSTQERVKKKTMQSGNGKMDLGASKDAKKPRAQPQPKVILKNKTGNREQIVEEQPP